MDRPLIKVKARPPVEIFLEKKIKMPIVEVDLSADYSLQIPKLMLKKIATHPKAPL